MKCARRTACAQKPALSTGSPSATDSKPDAGPWRARRERFFFLLPAFALLLGALFPFADAYAQTTLTGLTISVGTSKLEFKPTDFRGPGRYAVFVAPEIREVNVTPTWEGSGSFVMQALDATGGGSPIDTVTWQDSGDTKSLPLRPGYGATLLRDSTDTYEVYVYHHVSSADPEQEQSPPTLPEVSIAAGSGVTEGAAATFTLTADPTPAAPLTVEVTVTESGSYAATGAAGTRQVTVPTSGTASFTVATVDDSADEPDGSVTAAVGAGTGYTVSSSQGTATVAVTDNDDPPRVPADPPAPDPPPPQPPGGGGGGGPLGGGAGGGGGARAQSSDASLSGLTVSGSTSAGGPYSALGLAPPFTGTTTSYTATVANTTTHVKVTPTVNHSGATVTVNGVAVASGTASGWMAMGDGDIRINVVVTAQNGTKRTYRVTVTKVLGPDQKAVVDKVGKALLGLPE